jgi:hypothetical protein
LVEIGAILKTSVGQVHFLDWTMSLSKFVDSILIALNRIFLPLVFFQSGLIFSSAVLAEDYEFGQGWHGGAYYLSGYTAVVAAAPVGAPASLVLDDLSMLAGGRINQWVNPFTEIELSNYTLAQQSGPRVSGDVKVERFYNDGLVSENDTLRVGKMLTPLGDWNLVHAAPLQPITTTPYTAAQGFSAYTAGVNWLHDAEDGASPDFQLYWQPDNEWFKRPRSETIRNFHNVLGAHVNMGFDMLSKVGASFQHGQLIETGEIFTLYGINANTSFGNLKLQGEAITAHFSGQVLPGASPRVHDNETGIFGLADYSITSQWHGILEWEYYQDHTVVMPSRNTLAGINYKPDNSPVVWKLEYNYQAGVSASLYPILTGWQASFSTFF